MAELNTTATDKAYLCGRLLATLEKIHEAAISGVGKLVMERFYTRASTAPAFAFGILMQRVVPHLAKLERDKPGLQVLLSKQLQEIVDLFEDPTFPQTFDIPQQALFAIGYWQQRSFDIRAAIARKAAREAKTDTLQIPLVATEAEEETTL